jgi:hypothetical protein
VAGSGEHRVSDPRPAGPRPAITPERLAAWVEFALYVADRILQLVGRRKTDRTLREPDKTETPPL